MSARTRSGRSRRRDAPAREPEVSVFAMPSLGADMTEGRIVEWLVHPGDRVTRGQIVAVVETDKSDIEVEVFQPGEVVDLLVGEGERVPVGTPLAHIAVAADGRGRAAERVPAEPAERAEPSAPAEPAGAVKPVEPTEPVAGAPTPSVSPAAPTGRVTSPVIRHLADDLHVDVQQVRGTGLGGRVHRDDVAVAAGARPQRRRISPRARRLAAERGIDLADIPERPVVTGDDVLAYEPPPPSPAPADTRANRADTMRRHIAGLMTRSWHEIPHYHVAKRLDLSVMAARLAAYNEGRPLAERIVPGAVLLTAAARAAAAVPACNGWWRDDAFEPATAVRLGVVLSLRTGGIIVPSIERADEIGVGEMMVRLTELVQRARQGRLRASDLDEASITVTNLGDLGGDSVTGVIHPPQVGLVGFGAIHDEVWAVDGAAVIRPTVHASLAGDHRATDGVTGSRFLSTLQTLLDGELVPAPDAQEDST